MELLLRLLTHPNQAMKLFRLGKSLVKNLNEWSEVNAVATYVAEHLNEKGKLGVTEWTHVGELLAMFGKR